MSHADLGKGSSIEQLIPLTEHGCVSELISDEIMKRAMGSQEATAEFLADKIEQAADRGMFEIDQKFIDDICDDRNYQNGDDPDNSSAIFSLYDEDFAPGNDKNGMNNFRKLVNSVVSTASAMCWPSANFNYYKLTATNFNFKNMGSIISSEMFGQSQDYYGNVINPAYTEFKSQFAWVRVLPIYDPAYNEIAGNESKPKRDKHIILMNADGYVLDVDKESSTGFDQSRKIFRETWYYKWIDAFQDVAKGYNMVCWRTIGPKPEDADSDAGSVHASSSAKT